MPGSFCASAKNDMVEKLEKYYFLKILSSGPMNMCSRYVKMMFKTISTYVTRHDILCPNVVKRDVEKTRCKSDVILRNCTLLRNLLSGIC